MRKHMVLLSFMFFALMFLVMPYDNYAFNIKTPKNSSVKAADLIEKYNLNLFFQGKPIIMDSPIYIKINRFFIPFVEFIEKTGGRITCYKDKYRIEHMGNTIQVNLSDGIFTRSLDSYRLKSDIMNVGNIDYMSIFDLKRMLNLEIEWDWENKSIYLFIDRNPVKKSNFSVGKKKALVRLEDVAPGGVYLMPGNLRRLRLISDYLYRENIPFHVAWVPRYVDTSSNYDCDPVVSNSMFGSEFIYTLDYIIDRGGLIGLHGYTHQYGDTPSLKGYEFYTPSLKNIPSSAAYGEERIKNAIVSANILNIPYAFFETPHYGASNEQRLVMERYFDYIYEPYTMKKGVSQDNYYIKKLGKRVCTYVPAPLGYVSSDSNTNNIVEKINNIKSGVLASFYIHPFLEFKNILLYHESDGYPNFTYSEDSKLHEIVNAFKNKGYRFIRIYDVTQSTMD